tara:strand:+ start:265 stop:495 length:231 start_codon:yes stop_codon:yes gene_type:complete
MVRHNQVDILPLVVVEQERTHLPQDQVLELVELVVVDGVDLIHQNHLELLQEVELTQMRILDLVVEEEMLTIRQVL